MVFLELYTVTVMDGSVVRGNNFKQAGQRFGGSQKGAWFITIRIRITIRMRILFCLYLWSHTGIQTKTE